MVTQPQSMKRGSKTSVEETLLAPRFYTTDFEAIAQMDMSAQDLELQAMLEELRADYNRHHFVRNSEFEESWNHIDEETRRSFIDFLERSCTSEFSGFLLFKELSRRLKNKNPLLAEAFQYLSRDEARHAGFLNKAMADFNISLDLGYLTKHRTYTFFPPEWVIYTVYLSEKIGYWRYIIMYRHLEAHQEQQFYPLFQYFESWCQDENRHGDFFKVLLRSQPRLWNNWRARFWVRFFLLTVFVTHTLTVFERANFYKSVGIEPRDYNTKVIEKTNETSARTFPVIFNTKDPRFFPWLEVCSENNLKIAEIDQSDRSKMVKFWQKLLLHISTIWHMLRIYSIKPISTEFSRGIVL